MFGIWLLHNYFVQLLIKNYKRLYCYDKNYKSLYCNDKNYKSLYRNDKNYKSLYCNDKNYKSLYRNDKNYKSLYRNDKNYKSLYCIAFNLLFKWYKILCQMFNKDIQCHWFVLLETGVFQLLWIKHQNGNQEMNAKRFYLLLYSIALRTI